jgi:hypothetical protein
MLNSKLITKSFFFLLLTGFAMLLSAQPASAIPENNFLIVYGNVRYYASSVDPDTRQEYVHYNTPIKRARVVLFADDGSGMRYFGETFTWESTPGYFQFPQYYIANPAYVVLRIETRDNSRVNVVNPDNGLTHFKDFHLGPNQYGFVSRNLEVFGSYENQPEAELAQAFYIFDLTANTAYNYLQNNTNNWNDNRFLNIYFPQPCVPLLGEDSCYRGGIYLLDYATGRDPSVILHEYGHFVLAKYIGDWSVIQACASIGYSHSPENQLPDTCAWSEGWASYFQAAVRDHPYINGWKIENPYSYNLFTNIGDSSGIYNELLVAAVMWDMQDSNVDTRLRTDRMQDGFNGPSNNGVFYISSHYETRTWWDFYNAWLAIRGLDCNTKNVWEMNKFWLFWYPCSNELFVPVIVK